MDNYLRVIAVRPLTKNGKTPLLFDTAQGQIFTGYADSGVKVAVGDTYPASVLSWDRDDKTFWVWLSK